MNSIESKKLISSSIPLIETHCHLDYLKTESIEETLSISSAVGVEKIVTIAVEPKNQFTVLEIARKYDQVYCTQGVHPHEAKMWDQQCRENIIENAKDPKVVSIGEIGLDYHYDHSPRDVQRSVFEQQLQIASDLDLPVIVHSREADEDMKSILSNFISTLRKRAVVHCFTAGFDFAQYALSEDLYLGFNGIITFKKAQNVRDVLKVAPPEQILLETDAPFLSPIPHRGKENSPFYLPFIAKELAKLKEMDEEELLPIIYNNSKALFSL